MTGTPERTRQSGRSISRWKVSALVLALVAAACGTAADTTTTAGAAATTTTAAEAATTTSADSGETTTTEAAGAEVMAPEIPASTVRFSFYPCCADNNLYQVAVENGWFEEVGITLDPANGHLYTLFDQIVPSMQRADFDVSGMFIQGYLQTLDSFGMDIPPIWFNDIYVGYAILKAPGSEAKTTDDFVAEGMEIGEAMAAAVAQLEGAEVYTPPHGQVQPPYPDVFMSYAGLSYPDSLNLQFLEDNNIIAVATQEGRIEFAIPYAAPVVVQMLREGWEPVINTVQVLSDVGSEQAARMTTLVGSSGLIAQRDWVENNRETALRLLSVGFRILDYLGDPATQLEGWTIQANQINATQGLNLIPEDIGVIWDSIDPAFPWEEQGPQLWDDENAPFHVRTSLETQIGSLIENGTLTGPMENYDMDQFLLAETLYRELADLQAQADDLFAEMGGMDLSPSQQEVVDQAQAHYDNFNFLDAVRFLEAAKG